MKSKFIVVLRILSAAILIQTLFFKFTGAPESIFIFSTLHVEPWGRIFSGIVELFASILLLVPSTQIIGASVAMGVMVGAIFSHLFVLGVVIQDDGGLLFALACVVFASSFLIVALQPGKVRELTERVLRLVPQTVK